MQKVTSNRQSYTVSCKKAVVDLDDYKNKIYLIEKNRHGYEYFPNIKACTVHMLCIVCFVE